MSDKSISRRAAVEISFEGTDITDSIKPYLISMTYTDNEEDETDDLQIRLQDRDGIWMEKWLTDAVEAAGSTAETGGGSKTYTVTPKIGLNVRKGPGTGYAKLGALTCGTVVDVQSIDGGWAKIEYGGRTAYVSASYLKESGGGESVSTSTGLKIEAVIVRQNWKSDGKDEALECGIFELDDVECMGPPSEITIRATSLPFNAKIRQTTKSKGWEKYNLSGIAGEMAGKNGMVCMFLSGNDPFYERVEQRKMSDVEFLKRLCHDAGISLKATNKMLVLFDQQEYESKDKVLTIPKAKGKDNGDGDYISYRLSVGTADTQYQACRVSYNDPTTGKSIEGVYTNPDKKSSEGQTLEITAKVGSIAEAKALAEKRLRMHNKYCRSAEFTLPGNPALAAGNTVELQGWGAWSGKYIIKQASHSVGGGGYTTAVTLRKVLEGY